MPATLHPSAMALASCGFITGRGYRVYFANRGDTLILLLIGGDKDSQQRDIETAKRLAQEY